MALRSWNDTGARILSQNGIAYCPTGFPYVRSPTITTGMNGRSALMTSSLADAEALVAITTSRFSRQRAGLRLETQDLVAERVLVVVRILGEHLSFGPRAAEQAAQILGHLDEPAAVVAQVQHHFVHVGGAERREGRGQRVEGRLHEVPEEDVSDAAPADFEDPRRGHGRNDHVPLHQSTRNSCSPRRITNAPAHASLRGPVRGTDLPAAPSRPPTAR